MFDKTVKETAHCRDHHSQRFTKVETSVNLREILRQSYLTFEAQELHTASWQAQKHTWPVHRSPGIPLLVYSLA